MRGTTARLALGLTVALVAGSGTATAAEPATDGKPRIVRGGATRVAPRTPGQRAFAERAALAATGRVRLAVSTDRGADVDALVAAARSAGADLRHRLPQIGVVSIELPAAAADRVAAALARRPGVRSVTPVRSRVPHHTPDDPLFATNQAYLGTVNAPAAWDVTKGSADVLVAVVDSGVDTSHPDLAGKVAGSYNAVTGTSDVTDTVGHGTAVAGVAAASSGNGTGIAGAGYDSRVLAVKVADAGGSIAVDDEAAGIVWAADNGADVVNISLGGAIDSTEQAAVQYAQGKGAIVVASAGNDATSTPTYPAAYTGVIAVGATTGDTRATFSNYGNWVDVGAPGDDVAAPTPGTGYAALDGTSFAAPLVAGQVALLRAAAPDASATTIRTAVTAGTTGSYGFGFGRVDFAAALANLPPTTLPSLTAPADAATVSGDTAVTATTSAPSVRFAIAGGTPVSADAVEGVATTTLETYGRTGQQTVTATDCNAVGCGSAVTRTVTVDNGSPTITAPAPGTVVGTGTLTVAATTPDGGGGVRFLVNDVIVAFDGTAPYSTDIVVSTLSEGPHTLTAVLCNRANTVCDTAHPSAGVPFDVKALHPAIPSISPNPFSPNGDGTYESTTVRYTLDTTQAVVLTVKDALGAVVRGPGSLGTKAAGTYSWVWNGKRADGVVAGNGTYTVEIATSKAVTGGTITGFAQRTVKLDKTAPVLSSVAGTPGTFYPVKDGYRDTFTAGVTLGETGRLVLTVYNSAGVRVRTVDAGIRQPGRHQVVWNGRRADGSLLPAGSYRYMFTANDYAKNVRTTSRYGVTLSHKKLAARTGERTVVPYTSAVDTAIGACSSVFRNSHTGWTDGIGWYSNFDCYDPWSSTADLAVTEHAFALPSAVKYGNVRVAVTGERAVAGYPDLAAVVYLDPARAGTDYGVDTGSAYGTYWGPSVPSSRLLAGRTLRWIAGTIGGNWWDARSFTVRWVYYVLV